MNRKKHEVDQLYKIIKMNIVQNYIAVIVLLKKKVLL